MHSAVKIAKNTIEKYLLDGSILDTDKAPAELKKKRAGCFVSLHLKSNNELRGCIGTILPTCKNLAAEIINNAISACNDPRFLPVTKDELDNLDISVDILSEPESISSTNLLDPKKYGVIVKTKDGRTGLLLPNLEGVDDAKYQVAVARKKAGVLSHEPIFLYRFTVDRYKD